MALDLINKMVKEKLPYLVDEEATDTKIAFTLKNLFYLMQTQTGKTDDQVETESAYSNLERLFFADYTAYELLKIYISVRSTGLSGAAPDVAKTVKRAKADVVETEFEIIKGSAYTTAELLGLLKSGVCEKARMLNYSVGLCTDLTPGSYYPGKFRFIPG